MTSPPPPTFRPVLAQDVPALRAVIDSTTLFPSEMLGDMLAPYLEGTAGEALWLTNEGDTPLALAYCVLEPLTAGTCNLLLIAVHERARRTGLGAALLAHVEGLLIARGERLLLIGTSSDEALLPARAFYQRAGYEEEARVRDYYQPGEAKITFRKVLSPQA